MTGEIKKNLDDWRNSSKGNSKGTFRKTHREFAEGITLSISVENGQDSRRKQRNFTKKVPEKFTNDFTK